MQVQTQKGWGVLHIKHSVWLKWVGVAQILEDLECQSKKFELDLVGNRVVQRHFDQKSDIANGFFKKKFRNNETNQEIVAITTVWIVLMCEPFVSFWVCRLYCFSQQHLEIWVQISLNRYMVAYQT